MPRYPDDHALSEVVGFILLLALVVAALAVYQTYAVPAEGRDLEIASMNAVQQRFIEYHGMVTALWLSGQKGVAVSTSFALGTAGSTVQGGFLQILRPTGSSGLLGVDGTDGVMEVATDRTPLPVAIPLGSLFYRSDNRYWLQQTYRYQAGGLFLVQDDGVVVRIPPPISVFNGKGTAVVNIVSVRLYGNTTIGGSSPVLVTSRLRDTPAYIDGGDCQWVLLRVTAGDAAAADAWQRVFTGLVEREGIPPAWYQVGVAGNTAFLRVDGPSAGAGNDVRLVAGHADILVSLQHVATGLA
ncbi:MAG: hypothetical protein GKC04_01055 [Methanomicrobiales archaeon]|nr:hypothetical protein [Methanomicrobiales archaeon]